MTRFTTGSILGFLVGISIAAAQAPPKQVNCDGWKFDCAVLEAGILTLCGGDMEKYANVLQNMGWSAARAVRRKMGQDVAEATPQMYNYETESMNAIDRLQHNNVRDLVMQEAVFVLQEDAARKARDLTPRKKGQAARLDA